MSAPLTPEQRHTLYAVHWVSTLTGHEGHGQPMDLQTARAWVEECNLKYPELRHWLEHAKAELSDL